MDTVEKLNGRYFYYGMANLTAGELFFWIMVDETLNQLGTDDALAVALVLLGRNDLNTRAKPKGAIKATSRASVISRRIFKDIQFPYGISLPTLVGGPVRNLKVRWVTNLGTFAGRTVPFLGWMILTNDIATIIINTVSHYNKVARNEDKLYGG